MAVAGPAHAEPTPALTQRLSDTPRTLDLRNGVSPELADRYFEPGSRIVMSNPYVPVDRFSITGITSVACHPQSGLVFFGDTVRYDVASATMYGSADAYLRPGQFSVSVNSRPDWTEPPAKATSVAAAWGWKLVARQAWSARSVPRAMWERAVSRRGPRG